MLSRRVLCACARHASTSTSSATLTRSRIPPFARSTSRPQALSSLRLRSRPFSTSPRRLAYATTADEKVEHLQELYANAKDEFEIAAEETEKMTVYAQDDRDAAREELTKLQEAYKSVVEGPDQQLAKSVEGRVGQRIRELENAVVAMEEMAKGQD